ncbi:MAG: SsrA-binding protein SmpB [Solirubrobacterales bacterium]|nr:SsrA-binding protein SmpB [Solirubrobacterales bacterium]MCB8971414.1 SsrA-binding protein SmpB [Thermoleophilales bacterium]MCO5327528.1 SsrA-binding protein SmpB [Solirubrobacterales bacterium]
MSAQTAAKSKDGRGPDVATNRAARFHYEVVESFEAGIALQGTEVKSLRDGKARLQDSYCVIDDGEVYLRGSYIPPYPPARENHEPERSRKLLLHRWEIERLVGRMQRKGLTLIPTRIYFKGKTAKVELALARGKDHADKRRAIRDRDAARDVEREMKQRYR